MRRLLVLALAALAWAAPAHGAGFCGTGAARDRLPQTVPGQSIHLIYAAPADVPDGFATWGPVMQDDADLISSWWQAQDATRAPRFDLFQFPCGVQLDLSDVRLPEGSATYEPLAGRGALIAQRLGSAGFGSTFSKYVVYFDAPVADPDTCGQGGGAFDTGPSLAILFLRSSCSGFAPTAEIVAHELIHALGFLPPTGPPHECPGDRAGHVCDSEADILYPFASPGPLASLGLDVGRDDYYGHGQSWPDLRDSRWLRRLDAPGRLSVVLRGRGTVSSDVPGVECSASCESQWDVGSQVRLTPVPASGMRFVRWSGACSGEGSCELAIGAETTATAFFAPATFRLALTIRGTGTVRFAGRSCARTCVRALTSYERARLVASPAKGWRFSGWAGACGGPRASCSVPMSAATGVRATFVRLPATKPKR